jgi:hypothetical protein
LARSAMATLPPAKRSPMSARSDHRRQEQGGPYSFGDDTSS